MMKNRMREVLTEPLNAELLARRANEGWHPVAVEWQRDASEVAGQEGAARFEVPFGLEVTAGGAHLQESETEMRILRRILAQIGADRSLSEIADSLNSEGFSCRDGSPWTQSSIFEHLPRVIEMAPGIYASPGWQRDQARLRRSVS